ncbi:MAG: T9SS type A sorting domain-containing protein [Saprospiraceae bacterium]|nr:T9SS type A sorting domain-containing protein [Saprospiraceae bacterium]
MSSVAFSVASGSSDVFCSPWQDSLLGSGYASASYDECLPDTVVLSTNAVTASGATSDNQEIIYHELCGDGQVIAKVSALTGGYAGLFVRESLGAGARKCAIATQLGSQVFRQLRSTTNFIQFQAAYTATGNQWLKINRSGTQVVGYWSTNGTSWNLAFNTPLAMSDCVFVGPYAYSTNSNDTIQATFTNVSVEQSDTIPATTVAFADSLIEAQSGDSIQICVTLQNPCACSPVSVDVVLATDSLPHFEGYEPVTLTFIGSDTVQCFYVVAAQADTVGVYSFELDDVQGGHNTEITGPAALSVELDSGEEELPPGLCGSFLGENPEIDSTKTYYADRFGNIYEEEELLLPEELSNSCGCDEFDEDIPGLSDSYFNLVFEDCVQNYDAGFNEQSDDLGEERRRVACRVFANLSQIITPRSSPCEGDSIAKVNIQFLPYNHYRVVMWQNGPTLAAGSPVFEPGIFTSERGILDGLPWRMINNGRYTMLSAGTGIYHAIVGVDFTKLFYTGEAPPGIPEMDQYDLYDVLLHEALHVLGFFSLIRPLNGFPVFPSYNRYDTFLELEGGANVVARDVTNPYEWNLNISTEDLHKSCLSSGAVNMIFPPLTGDDIPVYTGQASDGELVLTNRAFSHLDVTCPGAASDYLMRPVFDTGVRVDIGEAELRILCALGYQIAALEDCSCVAVGDHDLGDGCDGPALVLELCEDVTDMIIDLSTLLENDQPGQGVSHLVSLTPNASTLEDLGGGLIRFTLCAPGVHWLKYIPTAEGCQDGSNAFVEILVTRCFEDCSFFLTDDPVNGGHNNNTCNLICNPEIVMYGTTGDVTSLEVNLGICNDLPGWFSATGTVDYNVNPSVYSGSGNIHMFQTSSTIESAFTPVNIVPGNYFFSFYSAAKLFVTGIFPGDITMEAALIDADIISQFSRGANIPDRPSEVDLNAGNAAIVASHTFPYLNHNASLSSGSFHREASCIEVTDFYTALWIYPDVGLSRLNVHLDEVELIPDNFSAGEDFVSTGCDPIGGPFCMLSDATVLYEWFEVSEGDTLLIAEYTVLNGEATVISGNVDEETQQLFVAPLQTTAYILRRSLATPHNLPESFAFCTTEDAVTVTVETPPPPAPEFGIVPDVCGLVTFYLNNLLPGDSSLITYGDGSSGTALVHTYANADSVYYASVFISNACRDTVLYVTVETSYCPPFTCEECTEHTIGVRGEILKLSDALAEELLPADGIDIRVCVEGTLLIDANYNMINSILYMLPGSRIEIEEDRALSVVESYLSGCDTMWYAIEVQKGGQMKMIGSRVTDAQYAVYLHPYDENELIVNGLSIYDNDFENNFVGFFVPRTSQGQIHAGVSGNRYTQKAATLLPPFEGQSSVPEGLPEQNQHALAGIIVNDLSGFASVNNRFDSLTSGIVGERSTLVSSRDTFMAMRNNEAFYPTWDFRGKGVSSQATGSQTALVEKGWFENCPQGIMANNTRLRATENKMLQVETGIWASLGNAGGITISDNHIEAAHLGIVAAHPDPNGTVTITGNYVETDTENAVAGILKLFSMSPTLLNTDTVLVKEAGTGIWGYGARRIFMRDNRVEMDDPAAAVAGIYLTNVTQSLLETNTVLGSGATGAGNIALHITASSGNVYCCNTLDNTRIGTYVSGGSLATDNFRGTSFSNHAVSLLLPDVNAILGTQTHTQNCWGTNAGEAVYGELTPVPLFVAQTYPFRVDDTQNTCFLPQDYSPTEWFIPVEDPANQIICNEEICSIFEFVPESDDVKSIALGDTLISAAVMWELQRYIYGRLQGEMVSHTTILSFLAQADTNSIGGFHSITRGIEALFTADSIAIGQLQTNLLLVEGKLDSIATIDGLLPEADSVETISLWSERTTLVNSLSNLDTDNRSIVEDIQDFISNEAGKLLSQNGSIAVAEDYEVNEKTVNAIYLSWLVAGFEALDSIQLTSLEVIAEQCPITGGNAVYRARAFLAVLTGEMPCYDDDAACSPPPSLRTPWQQQPLVSISELELSVYPNPADRELILQWKDVSTEPGETHLFDLYGRLVKRSVIGSGETEQTISLQDVANGLYFVLVRINGMRAIRRILVQH